MSWFGVKILPDFNFFDCPSSIISHVPHLGSPHFVTLFVFSTANRAFVKSFFRFGGWRRLFIICDSFTNSYMFVDCCKIGKNIFAELRMLWFLGLCVTTNGMLSCSVFPLSRDCLSSAIGISFAF